MFGRKKKIIKPEIEEKKSVAKVYTKPTEPEEEITEVEVEKEEPRQPREIAERIQVVKELPMAPVRDFKDKDGTIVHLVTIEEALTEMANQED